LIVDEPVPADLTGGRKPRGFDTGRAKPGRNIKPGTLEDLESTSLDSARNPRRKSVTRSQQLEGIDLAGAQRADPKPFMNDAMKKCSDPDHPLHNLVGAGEKPGEFDWHKTTRVTESGKTQTGRYQGNEHNPVVQAGHKEAFATRSGTQELMLEDADIN